MLLSQLVHSWRSAPRFGFAAEEETERLGSKVPKEVAPVEAGPVRDDIY